MTKAKSLNVADLVAALLFTALAVFILVQPFVSREPRLSPGDPGPWLLPMVFGVGLLLLSALLLLRSLKPKPMPLSQDMLDAIEKLRADDTIEDMTGSTPELERQMLPRLLVVAVLCIIYVLSFQHLGFYLATGAFLLLSIVALAPRSMRSAIIAAIVAVLTTAIVGLVLTTFLGVSLPRGSLF